MKLLSINNSLSFLLERNGEASVRVILKLSISKYILKEDTYAKHKKSYRELIHNTDIVV